MTETERIHLLLLEQSGELDSEQSGALDAYRMAHPDCEKLTRTLAQMTAPLPVPEGSELSELTLARILKAAGEASAEPAAPTPVDKPIRWGRLALVAVAAVALFGLATLFSPAPVPAGLELAAANVPDVDTLLDLLSEPYSQLDAGLDQADSALVQVSLSSGDPLAMFDTTMSADDELQFLIEAYLEGEG